MFLATTIVLETLVLALENGTMLKLDEHRPQILCSYLRKRCDGT
jgi:hypothetical protein